MSKGKLYFVTNPVFPHLVKIGLTRKDNVEDRGLSGSNVPEDFECLATFECEDVEWAEKRVHKQFSEFQHITKSDRKKEFFWIGCVEKAIEYAGDLRGVVFIPDNEPDEVEVNVNGETQRVKLPNNTFKSIGLRKGDMIQYIKDSSRVAEIMNEKNQIRFEGKVGSISAIASEILGCSANGFMYFSYEGQRLFDMRQ